MSSPGSTGDPRAGRDRRVPTRTRAFKHGTVDPVIAHRRPLLTWGNAILVAIMVAFGMYATGNLPQLDAAFDSMQNYGRAHNNVVVSAIITYGPYIFGAVILAVFSLLVFLFINSRRRQLSDPKGWHKVADPAPHRRHADRRSRKHPSLVHPLGKNLGRRSTDVPATNDPPAESPEATSIAAAATIATSPKPDLTQTDAPKPSAPDPAKAAAIAAATRAEAALDAAPADLPSFVRPFGKTAKPKPIRSSTKSSRKAAAHQFSPHHAKPLAEKSEATPAATPLAAAAAAAKVEAAIAAAKAAAARAEASMAAAKAEAAIAEAAMAAAKAEAETLQTPS